jgi:U3 small nucleolar RNA-associated protein 4
MNLLIQPEYSHLQTDRSKQLYTINRYQPVLFVDFLGPRSMVVVERPWLTVMSSFPAPLQRRRYGT